MLKDLRDWIIGKKKDITEADKAKSKAYEEEKLKLASDFGKWQARAEYKAELKKVQSQASGENKISAKNNFNAFTSWLLPVAKGLEKQAEMDRKKWTFKT